ncbi:MAG: NADPH:quinone oxidoreductase family protein, partial [Betaproteobacteria bacterium]|nr:NADPH:quinone oxidoreductase family protein [Betaproteobacteria bacterium]
MKVWLCENPVGVEALKWAELPTPQPGPDEVLIEIKAASLNFPDILIVQNKYQMKPSLPFVPGSEYAGVIQAIGSEVKHLTVGQSVACLSGTGGFGTHTLAPAKLCVPLPPQFPMVDAAAFIMIYATSYHALVDRAELKVGETVLVLGAAGGPVGGDFAEPAFRSIAWRGRYLVVGFAAGPIPSLPLNLALLKGASIVGVFWGDFA